MRDFLMFQSSSSSSSSSASSLFLEAFELSKKEQKKKKKCKDFEGWERGGDCVKRSGVWSGSEKG